MGNKEEEEEKIKAKIPASHLLSSPAGKEPICHLQPPIGKLHLDGNSSNPKLT